MKELTEEDRRKLTQKITVVHEEFELTGVMAGWRKVEALQNDFIPVIREKIMERFEVILEEEAYKAFKIFDTTEWYDGNDNEESILLDASRIDTLADRFKIPLSYNGFDVKECKKEWKKVHIFRKHV